jgi:uncharacterized protein
MSWRRRCSWRALATGACVVLVAGCATHAAKLADLRPQLSRGAYEQALGTVAKGTGGKDALLADLERGMILHHAGRAAESNAAFAAAERTADELYAASLSEGALSLITNDLAASYRARPFEMAMVPYYRALNYLALGDREGAMVEARKASLLLARYVDATLAGIERGPTTDLDRTRNDPFLLYFSGMLYDWDGEINDAFIAYRNAAVAYQDLHGLLDLQIPAWLAADLERTATWLGFQDEIEHLRAVCPAVFAAAGEPRPRGDSDAPTAGRGEVVLLVEVGFVPDRQQWRLDLPILKSDAYADQTVWAWDLTARAAGAPLAVDASQISYWLSIAVPTLRETPSPVRQVRVGVPGTTPVTAAAAHHPAAIARLTFAAELPTVLFRTILRGLTKYLATQQADRQSPVLGVLANIFSSVTEVADTRCWLTLPERIHLVRLRLPEGEHDLRLDLRDAHERSLGSLHVPGVTVRTGDWTFLSYRSFGP